VERRPGGREDLQAGRDPQEVGDERPGVDDLLEVVEDEQHLLAGQPFLEDLARCAPGGLGDPDRRRKSRGDEDRLAHRLERDEEDPVREVLCRVRGDLERQPRLARPAGSGQRHQPVRGEEGAGLLLLALPTARRT